VDKEQQRSEGHREHFPHQTDIRSRVIGATPEEAFAQSAIVMTAIITAPRRVAANETATITTSDPDPELLFVDFLNAPIFEMTNRQILTHLTRRAVAELLPHADPRLHYNVSHKTCKEEHRKVDGRRRRLYLHREPVDHLAERGMLIHSPSLRGVTEEAPSACKDMSAVVDVSKHAGLAKKVARLASIVVVKG
jgi:Archease protein family (MTH1598/TM1083)/tRNA-splicing ligase RtcB